MLERKVRFSQHRNGDQVEASESDARDYMRKCNQLVSESTKIKQQSVELESEIEKGLKSNEDKSRMIILLREKNKKLKSKLKEHQDKFQQYEEMLEHNIKLKERIESLQPV